MFRFQRNKRYLAFQHRLEREEQDKYIDHRFNKATVRKLTGLTGKSLDTFMIAFRPTYVFTISTNDYEFLQYVKLAAETYKAGMRNNYLLRKEEETF
jgi:hypothetical protein